MSPHLGTALGIGIMLALISLNAVATHRLTPKLFAVVPRDRMSVGNVLAAVVVNLGLLVGLAWVAHYFTATNWRTAVLVAAGLVWMQLLPKRSFAEQVTVVAYVVLAYVALTQPAAVATQAMLLMVLLVLTGAAVWFPVMRRAADGTPRFHQLSLPMWMSILLAGAIIDTAAKLDTAHILAVVTDDLGFFPQSSAHLLGSYATPLQPVLYGSQSYSIGFFTSITSFLFIGVMAVWASRFTQKRLVVLPIIGWIVGVAASLAYAMGTGVATVGALFVTGGFILSTLVAGRSARLLPVMLMQGEEAFSDETWTNYLGSNIPPQGDGRSLTEIAEAGAQAKRLQSGDVPPE